MDLIQLKYLVAVCEEESFSRAAQALNMTQPPLSIAIGKLEREIGVKLFQRAGRGIRPTQAGEEMAEAARLILADVDHLKEYMKKWRAGTMGALSLASVPSFNWAHLSPLLSGFLEAFPGVDPRLADPPPENVIELVSNGRVELGIVCTPDFARFRELHRERLEMMKIVDIPQIIGVPPNWGLPREVSLGQLSDKLWLMPARPEQFPDITQVMDDIWIQHGLPRPHIRHSGTLQTAIPLIASGMGVAVMPASVELITNGAISICTSVEPLPPVEAVLLWKRGRHLTAAAENFRCMALEVGWVPKLSI